jgi:hypothetical protein
MASPILDDPAVVLHHVDFVRRVGVFAKVGRERFDALNAHSFDDISPRFAVGLDRLLDEAEGRDFAAPHFLFMTDFCGSTLVANSLRLIEGITCLYELRVFAALAMRKRILDRRPIEWAGVAAAREDWRRVLRLAVALTARHGPPDGQLIIKEWPLTNYIVSDILDLDTRIRAVFLYSDLEDYLNAVFRRPWRREFTRRRVVGDLIETDLWPTVDVDKSTLSDAGIAATHWFVQQQAFLAVAPGLSERVRSLHSAAVFERPVDSLAAIARHFQIATARESVATAFAAASRQHSKQAGRSYSVAERTREMTAVRRAHRREIDEGATQVGYWLRSYPIPSPLPWPLPLQPDVSPSGD